VPRISSDPRGQGRVLFLSAFAPSLLSGAGAKTAFHEMLAIQGAYPLLLSYFFTPYEERFNEQIAQDCQEHGVTCVEPIKLGRFMPLLWAIVLFWLPASYVRRFSLGHLIRLWKLDYRAIYVRDGQALLLGVILGKLRGVPVLVSQADVLVQMSKRSKDGAKGFLNSAFWASEYAKLCIWEPILLRSVQACLVQSEKDAIIVRDLVPAINVRSFQPYLLNNLRFAPNREGGRQVLFWGAMNRKENEDAVLYYTERIHPEVLRRFPDYKFIVAGISPPPSIMALQCTSIVVTGFLEDPSDVFNAATIAVVPLRMGAGIKVKTMECLMMGLPTVATSVGAEGIDLGEAEGLRVRDSETGLAEAIVYLLESGARDRAGEIRQQVLDRYSFDRSVRTIHDTIRAFAGL